MIAPKRVLISGAGGFIGRHSVAPLLARGFEVHAVSHRTTTPTGLAGAALHRADLLDAAQVDALLQHVAPTHLLHFAWIATPGIYWQSGDNVRWARSSQHLMRRFREQGGVRAVMAGTCAEYDWSAGGVYLERGSALAEDCATPLTPYAAAKIELREALADFSRAGNLSSAWGRVFFQFGPDEHPDRLVPSVIRSLLLGQEALCTHGRQIRSWLHSADVGDAFASLLDSQVQGAVNIGSDQALSVADLIQRIAAQIDRPDLVRLGARAGPLGEPPVLLPDVHRLRAEVGWGPALSLDDGLADSIAWWRRNLQIPRPQ